MKRHEIWIAIEGQPARCHCCGDVPNVGEFLNGREVMLVAQHPNNSNLFVAKLA